MFKSSSEQLQKQNEEKEINKLSTLKESERENLEKLNIISRSLIVFKQQLFNTNLTDDNILFQEMLFSLKEILGDKYDLILEDKCNKLKKFFPSREKIEHFSLLEFEKILELFIDIESNASQLYTQFDNALKSIRNSKMFNLQDFKEYVKLLSDVQLRLSNPENKEKFFDIHNPRKLINDMLKSIGTKIYFDKIDTFNDAKYILDICTVFNIQNIANAIDDQDQLQINEKISEYIKILENIKNSPNLAKFQNDNLNYKLFSLDKMIDYLSRIWNGLVHSISISELIVLLEKTLEYLKLYKQIENQVKQVIHKNVQCQDIINWMEQVRIEAGRHDFANYPILINFDLPPFNFCFNELFNRDKFKFLKYFNNDVIDKDENIRSLNDIINTSIDNVIKIFTNLKEIEDLITASCSKTVIDAYKNLGTNYDEKLTDIACVLLNVLTLCCLFPIGNNQNDDCNVKLQSITGSLNTLIQYLIQNDQISMLSNPTLLRKTIYTIESVIPEEYLQLLNTFNGYKFENLIQLNGFVQCLQQDIKKFDGLLKKFIEDFFLCDLYNISSNHLNDENIKKSITVLEPLIEYENKLPTNESKQILFDLVKNFALNKRVHEAIFLPKFGVDNLKKVKEIMLSESFKNEYLQRTDKANPVSSFVSGFLSSRRFSSVLSASGSAFCVSSELTTASVSASAFASVSDSTSSSMSTLAASSESLSIFASKSVPASEFRLILVGT